jgi:hypothetical protein
MSIPSSVYFASLKNLFMFWSLQTLFCKDDHDWFTLVFSLVGHWAFCISISRGYFIFPCLYSFRRNKGHWLMVVWTKETRGGTKRGSVFLLYLSSTFNVHLLHDCDSVFDLSCAAHLCLCFALLLFATRFQTPQSNSSPAYCHRIQTDRVFLLLVQSTIYQRRAPHGTKGSDSSFKLEWVRYMMHS